MADNVFFLRKFQLFGKLRILEKMNTFCKDESGFWENHKFLNKLKKNYLKGGKFWKKCEEMEYFWERRKWNMNESSKFRISEWDLLHSSFHVPNEA